MLVAPSIVTLVRPVHPENASWPIFVTLSGMVTPVRFVLAANAFCSITVTLLGTA